MSKRFTIAFENEEVQKVQEIAEPLEIETDIAADTEAAGDTGLDAVQEYVQESIAIEQDMAEINEAIVDNDRVIEVTDNLEDIAAQVEAKPEGESVDIAMLQTAANMAVAGTDADAQAIIPSLESFKDKQLAVEAIGEKIKNALTAVFDSVKVIGDKLVTVVKNIFKTIGYLEKQLAEKEQAIQAITETVEFTVTGSDYTLVNGKHVTDAKEYLTQYSKAVDFYKKWTASVIPSVTAFTGYFIKWYTKLFAGNEARMAAFKPLYDSYVKAFADSIIGLPGVEKYDENSEAVFYKTPQLLGNVVIDVSKARHIPEMDADAGNSELRSAIINTKVQFLDKSKLINTGGKTTIEMSMTPSQLKSLIAAQKTLLDEIKKYLNSEYKRNITIGTAVKISNLGVKFPERTVIPATSVLLNRGVNHSAFYVSFSRKYGERLFHSGMIVLNKAIAASKTKE